MDDQNDPVARNNEISRPATTNNPITIIPKDKTTTVYSIPILQRRWFQIAAFVVFVGFLASLFEIPNNVMGWFINWRILFAQSRWQPPELPQGYQNIYLIFGGTSTEMTPQEIKTAHYMSIGGFEPIKWRIVENRFYIDVDIPIASEVIKVRGGQFSAKLPPKWDMNFNSNALEIVTENNNPIYQVYYRRPDQVVVNGIFARGNFLIAATTNGIEWWRGESNVVYNLNDFYSGVKQTGLRPIFKYPAFEHHGEYAH